MRFLLTVFTVCLFANAFSQEYPVGHHAYKPGPSGEELTARSSGNDFTTPPAFDVRTMAEWEEIQSLIISWEGFSSILKQIAFHAREECEVIILTENENQVISYLQANNNGGAPFSDLNNITILEMPLNSIWGRDYGGWTAYKNDVDEAILVDWIYNRNRPSDDVTPSAIGAYKGHDVYTTTESPWDLMATGGNYMVDGMGTAFSSELISEENNGSNLSWGGQEPNHSLSEIQDILEEFMGIHTYINMESLPYDIIHHIDMHMKLMDEETILFGEYPSGVADGPQIEANIQYVLSNYTSPFGTPYKVERVQMPPQGGAYPNNGGDYRTYTNMVFVNKTILVPTYQQVYDTPALAKIQELMPGYNVQGINCNDIIPLSGAIHCITKAVGVDEPMHIVHQPLEDTEETIVDYQVDAMFNHISGIAEAQLFYRLDGGAYVEVDMTDTGVDNTWTAMIPAQEVGTLVDYYVHGVAVGGKELSRPITAPAGNWTFEVLGEPSSLDELIDADPISRLYPNPASAITVVELDLPQGDYARVSIVDVLGQHIKTLEHGMLPSGKTNLFFDAAELGAGMYQIQLTIGDRLFTKKLLVH